MAKDASFDIVSQVDEQEVSNAVNQAVREMEQRFDFKGSKSKITKEKDKIVLISDDEYKLKNVTDILESKMVKRGISLRALQYGKVEDSAGNTVKQQVDIVQGISKEKAKEIIKLIKDSKIKVQTQIQDDQLRVSGKKKDDLQNVIALLKNADLTIELQFINFRS
ncbi:YajQ family cyclic di-GMP-binding protein [Heliorestis acidaminivorans]|uniref:Nucleotide-binding protein F9B85_01170 n=1 Tax=Heliorestis acidaminivorans TaxID=553427 RepID=A0A6I0F3K4_9FIRM|nr:YajQ family cyclic di-GMP-binding protein [Heliorestis acidaminivorans]KAB2954330.1 YajQ family cyclic di-GMP-binding protein [Heliorestis acidaminivorans]